MNPEPILHCTACCPEVMEPAQQALSQQAPSPQGQQGKIFWANATDLRLLRNRRRWQVPVTDLRQPLLAVDSKDARHLDESGQGETRLTSEQLGCQVGSGILQHKAQHGDWSMETQANFSKWA